MRLLAPSPSISVRSEVPEYSTPFVTVRLLRAAARFVETHGWILLTVVLGFYGWFRLNDLGTRHLDHDELYTFYIAQAPTLRQLLELTRTVDLHPPLSYLLVRVSFSIFGVSAWSCRLPSILAFVATFLVIFWLVSRILSPLYGIISVLLFWSVALTYQSDEARPYSLLLCCTAVMTAGWYRAIEASGSSDTEDQRYFALAAVSVGGCAVLLSHVLGVFPYTAFLAAEVVRWLIRRKSDWRLWTALLCPAITTLSYVPLIHHRAGILFTGEYSPTPARIFNFYWDSLRYLAVPLVLVAILAWLWPLWRRPLSQEQRQTASTVSRMVLLPFVFLLSLFFLLPVGVGILFARTGTAFFERYGIVAFLPIAIGPALLLGFCGKRNRMAGLAVALTLSLLLFLNTSGKVWLIEQLGNLAPPTVAHRVLNALTLPKLLLEPVKPMVPPHLLRPLELAHPLANLDAIDPGLPVVANTGLTFLEIDRQADAELASRLYLLNDRQSAAAIAHDTVFENYDQLKKVFPIRGRVESYCSFIGDHPQFLVLGAYNHPQGWLLKKLDMDGARLNIIGTYAGITEDAQVYEVNVANAGCPRRP
jgi:4-amino-4-deoxy-L-arabinose transferase-like glycosyltransferase